MRYKFNFDQIKNQNQTQRGFNPWSSLNFNKINNIHQGVINSQKLENQLPASMQELSAFSQQNIVNNDRQNALNLLNQQTQSSLADAQTLAQNQPSNTRAILASKTGFDPNMWSMLQERSQRDAMLNRQNILGNQEEARMGINTQFDKGLIEAKQADINNAYKDLIRKRGYASQVDDMREALAGAREYNKAQDEIASGKYKKKFLGLF